MCKKNFLKNIIGRALAFAAGIALIINICGCGMTKSAVETVSVIPMESVAVLDYTLPKNTPGVIIDKNGYHPESLKRAVLAGKKLPESFDIIDAETGETVFSGEVKNITYSENDGKYVGYAEFDDLDREGEYYIRCEHIGFSYTFRISEAIYAELYNELYAEFVDSIKNKTADEENILALLLSYEYHPGIYGDENSNDIPDVLEYIKEWVRNIDYTGIEASKSSGYVAVLAKYSYLYQDFDRAYATECIQRASSLFNQSKDEVNNDGGLFFALTEMYRATGRASYGDRIIEYKEYLSANTAFTTDRGYLYGAMTYMLTRQRIDTELCQLFMDRVTDRGVSIMDTYRELIKPTGARNSGADDVLSRAVELSCSNVIFKSYQYDCIEEDFLHYLLGCNMSSEELYPGSGSRNDYLILLGLVSDVYNEE
ncbi:MAG: glycoside hydrolase family 9 protein [Lachnospiraceae bacterium]|nr:glycoside hydrolase family 9 protein [Lachnospiraceae bacterium]